MKLLLDTAVVLLLVKSGSCSTYGRNQVAGQFVRPAIPFI